MKIHKKNTITPLLLGFSTIVSFCTHSKFVKGMRKDYYERVGPIIKWHRENQSITCAKYLIWIYINDRELFRS